MKFQNIQNHKILIIVSFVLFAGYSVNSDSENNSPILDSIRAKVQGAKVNQKHSLVDLTIGNPSICPIHLEEMKMDTVENIGHANLGLDYLMIALEKFPYSLKFVMGNSDFNKAIVYLCEECIKAEWQWKKDKKNNKEPPPKKE